MDSRWPKDHWRNRDCTCPKPEKPVPNRLTLKAGIYRARIVSGKPKE